VFVMNECMRCVFLERLSGVPEVFLNQSKLFVQQPVINCEKVFLIIGNAFTSAWI